MQGNTMKIRQKPPEKVWAEFQEQVKPTKEQLLQFQRYAAYLLECNEFFNITALTELSSVVRQHFHDSLALANVIDLKSITSIADIGTGGGFPGLPLKIMFPHLKVLLLEVNKKKQGFLADVVKILGLTDVEICGVDWRTFLRTTDYTIDLFVTRAALDDLELIRVFKPSSPYNKSTLVYWVSKEWEPHPKVQPFIRRSEAYRLGHKDRKLIFMAIP
jgi:16S rRNA (guanine(527)-N(7))-methyltransferase RsmG